MHPRPLPAVLLAAIALVVVAVPSAFGAAPDALEREAIAIEGDLMSPYCPGRTIASCPSPAAAELRQEIRVALGEGQSTDEVVAGMERRFGPDVLGRPKAAWGWIGPLAFPVLGGLVIVFWVRRQAARSSSLEPPEDPSGSGANSEVEQQLDRELEALR